MGIFCEHLRHVVRFVFVASLFASCAFKKDDGQNSVDPVKHVSNGATSDTRAEVPKTPGTNVSEIPPTLGQVAEDPKAPDTEIPDPEIPGPRPIDPNLDSDGDGLKDAKEIALETNRYVADLPRVVISKTKKVRVGFWEVEQGYIQALGEDLKNKSDLSIFENRNRKLRNSLISQVHKYHESGRNQDFKSIDLRDIPTQTYFLGNFYEEDVIRSRLILDGVDTNAVTGFLDVVFNIHFENVLHVSEISNIKARLLQDGEELADFFIVKQDADSSSFKLNGKNSYEVLEDIRLGLERFDPDLVAKIIHSGSSLEVVIDDFNYRIDGQVLSYAQQHEEVLNITKTLIFSDPGRTQLVHYSAEADELEVFKTLKRSVMMLGFDIVSSVAFSDEELLGNTLSQYRVVYDQAALSGIENGKWTLFSNDLGGQEGGIKLKAFVWSSQKDVFLAENSIVTFEKSDIENAYMAAVLAPGDKLEVKITGSKKLVRQGERVERSVKAHYYSCMERPREHRGPREPKQPAILEIMGVHEIQNQCWREFKRDGWCGIYSRDFEEYWTTTNYDFDDARPEFSVLLGNAIFTQSQFSQINPHSRYKDSNGYSVSIKIDGINNAGPFAFRANGDNGVMSVSHGHDGWGECGMKNYRRFHCAHAPDCTRFVNEHKIKKKINISGRIIRALPTSW